jgi:hypothetical protein
MIIIFANYYIQYSVSCYIKYELHHENKIFSLFRSINSIISV